MRIRKISASFIFSSDKGFLKNGILSFREDGIIVELSDTGGLLQEFAMLEQYNGILCPVSPKANKNSYAEMFEKLIEIHNYQNIPLNQLLTMSGKYGIGEPLCGRFEEGKRADIILIEQADLQNMRLNNKSTLKVLFSQ